jgi:hypothetical protein
MLCNRIENLKSPYIGLIGSITIIITLFEHKS